MDIRQAEWKDIKLDAKLVYQKNPKDCSQNPPNVVVRGFSAMFKTAYNQLGVGHSTLCVVQKNNGEIILALEDQLFVRVG